MTSNTLDTTSSSAGKSNNFDSRTPRPERAQFSASERSSRSRFLLDEVGPLRVHPIRQACQRLRRSKGGFHCGQSRLAYGVCRACTVRVVPIGATIAAEHLRLLDGVVV